MFHLNIGDNAPDFSGLVETGETVSLADYRGKKLILFFYPKDNTPGCTAVACDLSENYSTFKKKGFELLGVSPDDAKKHKSFIQKHEFPFHLIADTQKEILTAYGVWGEKRFMGKVFDGVHRSTFVISETGVITHIITKVNTKEASKQLFELI